MVATLLIWLSAAVAVLALADLFLSKAQKNWLSDRLIKLWNRLDEAKGWSFADWLKQPRAAWWLAVSLGLFMGGGIVILTVWLTGIKSIKEIRSGEWLWIVGVVLPGLLFVDFLITIWARHIFVQILNSKPGVFLVRWHTEIALYSLFTVVALILLELALLAMTDLSLFRTLAIAGIRGLRNSSLLVLLCLLWIFVARALAYLASAILYIGEFSVRRIAEYPKGPVLAMSAVFGGIVALIKAFSEG
jgi:hypothetical protein